LKRCFAKKKNKAMLEYQMLILRKVSFDKLLFKKEIKKSFKWLTSQELNTLYKWLKDNFTNSYDDVIDECFTVIPT